jgi:O-antigen/teichoic acid export membrane protein
MTDQQQPTHSRIITPLCDDGAVEPEVHVQPAPARLRTDVFLTFGGKLTVLALGFVTVAVVARELGTATTGVFLVAYSLTLLLTQVGGLGLTTANPYFAAREPSQIAQIVSNSLWLAIALGAVLALVGAAIKVVFPNLLEGLGWVPLGVTLIGLPGALAALLLQSVLLGEGRMVAYNGVEAAQATLTLAAIVVGFLFFDFALTGTLAVIAVSRYVAATVYLILLGHRALTRSRFDRELARRMFAYGLRVYVAIVLSYLLVRFDLLLVNAFLGSSEAGLYGVAATFADGMFVIPMVISLNLFPRVARGDPIEASAEIFRSVTVLYGLLCLVTIPLAGPVITTFFGESYADAVPLYYWLLPGIYAYGLVSILSSHFVGRGFPRAAIVIWAIGITLNIALNVIFLPGRGAWVASVTSSISYGILLVMHMWLFAREAGGYGVLRPRPREVVQFVRVALSRG